MSSNLDEMMDRIIGAYDKWNMRISTGLLNDWLEKFKKLDNLPREDEQNLRINYLIQAKVRPPLFIFFVNKKSLFKGNYERFLLRNLAKEFGMDGIPLRLVFRSTNNKENRRKPEKRVRRSPLKSKMEELKKKYQNFGL